MKTVQITLSNPLNSDDHFTIRLIVNETNVGHKWFQALAKTVRSKQPINKDYCFLGWPFSLRSSAFLQGQIEKLKNKISTPLPDLSVALILQKQISIIIKNNFEGIPEEEHHLLRELQLLLFEYEHCKDINSNQMLDLEVVDCNVIANFEGREEYEFEDQDYRLFTLEKRFGTVHLNYSQDGQSYFDAYMNGSDTGKPLNVLTSEFVLYMGRNHCDADYFIKDVNGYKKWLEDRNLSFNDKRLAHGWIPVAELDMLMFQNCGMNEIQRKLSYYMDIYSIELFDENRSICKNVYPYNWTDKISNEARMALFTENTMKIDDDTLVLTMKQNNRLQNAKMTHLNHSNAYQKEKNKKLGNKHLVGIETNDILKVTWSLSNFCNYRCSYCNPGSHSGDQKNITMDHVIRLHHKIRGQHPNKKILHCFSGGEPLFFPEFKAMVKELKKDDNVTLMLTTNCSRGKEWWYDIIDCFSSIVVSYHPEFTKKDKLIDTLEYLTQHIHVDIDMMMTVAHFFDNLNFSSRLEKLPNLTINFLPIQKNWGISSSGIIDYPTEMKLQLQQLKPINTRKTLSLNGDFVMDPQSVFSDGDKEKMDFRDLIKHEINHFWGWKCNIGIDSLVIDLHGTVWRGYCGVGGKLGTVHNINNIHIPLKFAVCNVNICHCSSDIEIAKWK